MEGLFFFLSNYLASFWHTWVLFIHLSGFWCARYKNLPLCHLGQRGDSPCSLTVCGIRVSGVGGSLQDLCQEAWRCCSPQPASQYWTMCLHIWGTSWSLQGTPVSQCTPVLCIAPVWPAPLKWAARPTLRLMAAYNSSNGSDDNGSESRK